MGTQQFCLKWNNHHSNMLTVFEQLLSTEALVDVTLACDGLSLKAHKMVLSACSPFFQSLFLENPCKHPIVIMKDMRYSDLKAIIDFMYRGEVNVSHDQLSALLKTAETLKVKGLAEVSGENRHASGIVQQEIIQNVTTTPQTISSGPPSQQRSETPTLHSKRKRGRPRKRSLSDSNRSDNEDQVPSKIKEPDSPEIEELSGDASLEPNDIRGVSISSNSQSQVSVHPSLQTSTVHNALVPSKTHPTMPSIQSQDSQVSEEPTSGDEGDFEVEPSKLMEQTLTTDNVPALSNSQPQSTIAPVSVHLPLPSSSGLIDAQSRSIVPTASGDSQALVPVSVSIPSDSHSSSQMQGPDSPQDIKPALLSFEEPPISPVAGPSHQSDRSMMMYMDASGVPAIPGPSNYQPDNQTAITQHEQQPQGLPSFPQYFHYPRNRGESAGHSNQHHPSILQTLLHDILPPTADNTDYNRSSNSTTDSDIPAATDGSNQQTLCSLCNRNFSTNWSLRRHLLLHRPMRRKFQCPSCPKEFSWPGDLRTHMRSTHGFVPSR